MSVNTRAFWAGLNKFAFVVFEIVFLVFSISTSAHFLHAIFGNWGQAALGLIVFEGGLIGWRAKFAQPTDPYTKGLAVVGMLASGTASIFSTVADIILIQSRATISPDWSTYTLWCIGGVTAAHLILILGLALVANFGNIATESESRQWEQLPVGEWQPAPAPALAAPPAAPTAAPTAAPAKNYWHHQAQPTPPAAPAMPAMPAPTAAPAKNYWHHQAASPAAPPPPPAAPAMPTMPTVDDSHPQRPAWLYPVNPAIDPND